MSLGRGVAWRTKEFSAVGFSHPANLKESVCSLSSRIISGGGGFFYNEKICDEQTHIHSCYEIYVNVSGDVSFLVENNLYDLKHGDVIIARPGEYHHCVYRSDAPHKLFWILFDCQKNKDILDFLKDGFRENYISPQGDLREELIDLCYALHHRSLTNEEKIYAFFRIFAILKQSKNNVSEKSLLSHELHKIIDYIETLNVLILLQMYL